MRENSIDEFESIFEQASVPVLDISQVALTRIGAVLTGDPLDDSILTLGDYLKKRFGASVEVFYPKMVDTQHVQAIASKHGISYASSPFHSTAELIGQMSIVRCQLVLVSDPDDDSARIINLNDLVQGAAPPVLILRQPVEKPANVFSGILHALTGNFRQKQNFAFPFTLAEDQSRLMLLHVIDDDEVQDVRDTLQVSPEIAASSGEKLLQNLTHHGDRYLKGVVAASRERPFEASYRLAVGDIATVARDELDRGQYGLLVVGSHHEGHSHVAADDYQLMHEVRDIPVLAL